ncbi:MerR family transcriptional regulator [Paracoccus sp. 08]|uniref:MerR family transcriptional regulator n=1 Tax=Paracoccus sp. 08 TaxID=2606624 RepID=UPI00209636A2|nr:MerR family transcriptional regulator [Paracoccus sp. 08]MCO6363321.1 MerR family transcriptional regulator [Paracoccus sp. 08]
MAKGAEAFRSIGEVATLIGVAPHVLRYWETQFSALKPMKRPDGRRYYRPADVEMAAGICALLRDDGLTIRGAIRQIATDRGQSVRRRGAQQLSPPRDTAPPAPAPAPAPARIAPVSPPSHPPVWLARLSDMARHLQQISPVDRRWPRAKPVVIRLAQAMLSLS